MASDDPMAEIRASFFIECEELLEALQDGLSDLEDGSGDLETINTVFRAVHSIKGGAAAFGLDALVGFAHGYESALDIVRKGTGDMPGDAVQISQQCADFLGDLIVAAREGTDVDTAPGNALVAQLTTALGGEVAQTAPPPAQDDGGFTPAGLDFAPAPVDFAPAPVDFTPAPLEEISAQEGWQITIRPHADMYQTGNDTRALLKALRELGDVTAHIEAADVPTLDQFDLDQAYIFWTIELVTDASREQVEAFFAFVEGLCQLAIVPLSEARGPQVSRNLATPPSASEGEASLPQTPQAATTTLASSNAAPETPSGKEPASTAPATPAASAATKPVAKPPAAKQKASGPAPTVRVDLDRIDRLINQVGELVINQAMLSQSAVAEGLPPHSPVLNGLDEFLRLTRDIQDSVMLIRAQPVKPLFQRMARIVRESSAQVGKDVRLATLGEATEIDKTVIERLAEPLTHMIRNAVDHGLEDKAAREASGKSPVGTVTLSAAHRSGRVILELSDDGGGINRERVLAIAIEKGLVPETAQLSPTEIDNLLFLPGFSTAKEISDLSGRGVGMDVVKTSLQDLGGRISIASTPGAGTTFTISLPLTLAVLDGMVVGVEDQTLVLPLNTIQETLTLDKEDLLALGNTSQVIRLRGRFLPVIDLGVELGYRAPTHDYDERVALIIQTDDGTEAALVIDRILEQRQVVIKGLQESFGKIPGVAAATILGDGRIALILDPVDIITAAGGAPIGDPTALQESA